MSPVFILAAAIVSASLNAALVAALLMGWAAGGPLGAWLQHREALGLAEVIVVIDGGHPFRGWGALDLYAEGLAPRILFPREDYAPRLRELHRAKSGYGRVSGRSVKSHEPPFPPDEALEVWGIPSFGGTREELTALKAHLAATGVKRAILVTSDYHALRVRLLFDLIPSCRVSGQVHPSPYGGLLADRRWLDHPATSRLVLREYAKLILQTADGLLALPFGQAHDCSAAISETASTR